MSVLSLNNVKKSYKLGDGSEFPVLKGINVSFEDVYKRQERFRIPKRSKIPCAKAINSASATGAAAPNASQPNW